MKLKQTIREALITKPKGEYILPYQPIGLAIYKSGIEMDKLDRHEYYQTELRFGTQVVVSEGIPTGEKVAFANERTMPLIMEGIYGEVRREILDTLCIAYETGADMAICERLNKLARELR